jgi:excisionase family DNA binding protein
MSMPDSNEYYSVKDAARVLKRTERRVNQLLEAGELTGRKEAGKWLIPKHAVHEMLPATRRVRQESPEPSPRVRELEEELRALERDLGRMEGRLELTERADSTLREQLERERQRADRMEEEARALRERLEEARQPWWRRWFG